MINGQEFIINNKYYCSSFLSESPSQDLKELILNHLLRFTGLIVFALASACGTGGDDSPESVAKPIGMLWDQTKWDKEEWK